MTKPFVFQDPRLKKTPVVIRKYVNGGPKSGGTLVAEYVLRPLTKDEKKNGARDLLAEHARVFGRISAPRTIERTLPPTTNEEAERDSNIESGWGNDIPEELQLEVWHRMQSYYWAIARMASADGIIPEADEESFVLAMQSYVVGHLDRFDPSRTNSSNDEDAFDNFCKQQARDFRGKFTVRKFAAKRGGGVAHIALVGTAVDGEDSDGRCGCVSEDVVSAVSSSRARDSEAFLRDFNDYFAKHLTKRERIALKELYEGQSQQFVADLLGLKLTRFRRSILGQIQLVVDLELPAEAHRYRMPKYGPRKFIIR